MRGGAEWLLRHRRSVLFVFVVLAVAGAASALRLPVALFPHVDFPRIVVDVDAGDRPADRMAVEVTRPVEEALRGVPGARRVRSDTSRGSAQVSVTFDWGDDMVAAMLMSESAVNQTLGSLPAGTSFDVRRMDPTVFPVLAYSLTSDTVPLTDLRRLAQYDLRPMVTSVEGVAHADVLGGHRREYRVTVDPSRLAAYDLTPTDVADALESANVIVAVGRIEDLHHLYLVVSQSPMQDAAALGRTVLRSGEDGAVRLDDVATVSEDVEPQWTRVTADGHDAVLLQVYQQPTGNTVAIADAVKSVLKEHRSEIPAGVQVATWYDQSELIRSSAVGVRDAVLIGAGLASLVLLVFLRSFRTTVIAAITVPAVLATTTLLLNLLGMSFNVMTLGGMAAAVGLIIDDMVVMVEHVAAHRHDHEQGMIGVLRAGGEFTRPLVASSTATVIVFAPLAFLSGVTGAFFKALSLTMASSLVISFFVAWLVVPLLSALLLPRTEGEPSPGGGRVGPAVLRRYRAVSAGIVRRPWLALLAVVPLLALGWLAYRSLGTGFMPAMDEGGFVLDYRAAAGTSLSETDRLCRQIERILQDTPEVQSYSRRTGVQLGGGLTEANEGDYFVRLRPPPRRGIEQVMDEVRGKIERGVPGLDIEMPQLMEDLIGDLTAVPQPIEIEVFSNDESQLQHSAPRIASAIDQIPGVVDVQTGVVLAGDAVEVEVDQVRASLEGVDPGMVTDAVAAQLDGVVATDVQRGPEMIGVRVWVPPRLRRTTSDVGKLRIRAPDGHLFPLERVANIRRVSGQPQITRDDLERMVAVTGRISGRDMGSVMRDVEQVLARPDLLPAGTHHRLGGLYAEQQSAFAGLLVVLCAAVALVFALLLFLYESFRIALAMMATTLLAMCAVLIGLWVTGTPLNISSMMGMTMIVGIVTEVAIFYVQAFVERRGEMGDRDALIEAGVARIRPIAMTTLAAILALAPLAVALGPGAQMQQPLAVAIIGGLTAQLPLVLLVLPALLRWSGVGREAPATPSESTV